MRLLNNLRTYLSVFLKEGYRYLPWGLVFIMLAINIFQLYYHQNQKKFISDKYRYLQIGNAGFAPDSEIDQNQKLIVHFIPLKELLEKKLGALITDKKIGLYIQDGNTGAWLGINEREGYLPASLLKVPIAMAVLKKVERGMLDLDDQITILAEDLDESSGTKGALPIGAQAPIRRLIELDLRDSNNTAKNVLKRQLDEMELEEIFTHVGIPNPYSDINSPTVTPRGYGRIMKALFISTFLTKDGSQMILDSLVDARREDLIAGGVPWEVPVAHKYGEREDMLHDCAIVYQPGNPYLVCIMTKQILLPEARELMKQISASTYDYIQKSK